MSQMSTHHAGTSEGDYLKQQYISLPRKICKLNSRLQSTSKEVTGKSRDQHTGCIHSSGNTLSYIESASSQAKGASLGLMTPGSLSLFLTATDY